MAAERSAGPFLAPVLACEPAGQDVQRLVLRVPQDILGRTRPGQFADIQVPDDPGWHILRRPFSLAGIYPGKEQAVFYFRCAGPGTRRLAKALPGQQLNVLLPLGNGYTPPEPQEEVWLVGGGTGAASVLSLPGFYEASFTLFLGFHSLDHVFGLREVTGVETYGAYDSEGVFVTDLLRDALAEGRRPDRICACGPEPMYQALAAIVQPAGIPVEISLEERMGCGTGGCQACVARVRDAYVRTCTCGPVFPLEEVDGLG